MKEKMKDLAEKAKEAMSSAAVLVGDLNGDGKVDHEDAKIAAEWAKKRASVIGDEAAKLGKEALESTMVKDAAAGAVVGAAIAIPVPVIGPLAGAAIGAGLGVYKNIVTREPNRNQTKEQPLTSMDVHAELVKFDDLRQKGIISEEEFEAHKKRLLATC
ncbi:MAG: SHOCT domain-containing protein [Geobacteraceae bacterium]|nr:SHOCT domain-containing protein [Geobacteraceae bacterium]